MPNVILKDGSHLHFGVTPTTIPERPYGVVQGGITRVSVRWADGVEEHRMLSDKLLIEKWDYKGLLLLKKGDRLKIKDQFTKNIICQGQVDLIPLKIHSQKIDGHFQNINQPLERNCNWKKYFIENYSAELQRD